MANLQFLRGSQASLNDIKNKKSGAPQVQDGAFYLTTDTNRLYVGQKTGTTTDLVELNKSVTSVETLSSLPKNILDNSNKVITRKVENGQFYYVTDINVLCVYSETLNNDGVVIASNWTQINPDTSIRHFCIDSTNFGDENEEVVTNLYIKENLTHGKDESNIPANTNEFRVTQTFATENLKVIVKEEDDTNISEDDENSVSSKVTFIGDTYDINVKTTEHTKDEENEKITAYNKSTELYLNRNIYDEDIVTDVIKFEGENGISLTSSEDTEGKNDAAITVRGTLLTDIKTELDTNLISGENAPAGIRLTITDDRNPSGYETSTAFIPRIHYGQKTVMENDEPVVKNTATATVKTGTIIGNETNSVYDFDLSVYTKSEIDDILDSYTRTADALRYKGTINAYSDLAKKTSVLIGDTYKLTVQDDIKDNSGNITKIYKVGDIFIANIAEDNTVDENGYIIGTVVWNHIPAGNDTYKGFNNFVPATEDSYEEAYFQIVNGENDKEVVASLGVQASDKLTVYHNITTGGGSDLIYTIKHDEQDVPDANAKRDQETDQTEFEYNAALGEDIRSNNGDLTITIPVLDTDDEGNLKVDKYGHITGYDTKIFNLTHNHLKRMDVVVNNISDDENSNYQAVTNTFVTAMADKADEASTDLTLKTTHTNLSIVGTQNISDDKYKYQTGDIEFNLIWGEF